MNPLKLYKLFFPMIKKEREEYLERVRKKVDFYKPRMEEKIGFGLGNIQVKEYKEHFETIARRSKEYKEYFKTIASRSIENVLKNNVKNLPLIKVREMFLEDCFRLAYLNSSIYVPFGIKTKVGLLKEEFFDKGIPLDKMVIHELSHHLWSKVIKNDFSRHLWRPLIKKNKVEEKKRRELWSEGFAEYCALDYFADIYSKDYKFEKEINQHPMYMAGYKAISKLVEKYGENIILKVPLQWNKFDNEVWPK